MDFCSFAHHLISKAYKKAAQNFNGKYLNSNVQWSFIELNEAEKKERYESFVTSFYNFSSNVLLPMNFLHEI